MVNPNCPNLTFFSDLVNPGRGHLFEYSDLSLKCFIVNCMHLKKEIFNSSVTRKSDNDMFLNRML